MTREEAIALFEKQLTAAQVVLDSGFGSNPGENNSLYRRRKEMAEIALSALRPVSREQVEKVWRGEWNYSHKTKIDGFDVVQCSKCGQEALTLALYVKNGNFCPYCGAPLTDKAVEMTMKRMKVLRDDN